LGGIVSGFLLYAPWVSFSLAVAMLLLWLLTTGGAVAVIMSLLPHVVRDPRRGAAASGLLAQVMAVGTFLAPAVFFSVLAKGNWVGFVALVLAGWLLSLVFLPAWKARRSLAQRVVAER